MTKYMLIISILSLSVSVSAKVWKVKTTAEYLMIQKKAQKGDSVVWQSGVYPDVQLELEKNGLNICAEKPGSVTFTGNSFFKLKADSVHFSGFQFKDGKTKDDIFEVSGNYNLLENLNFSNYHSKYYLNVLPSGEHNLISKCNFERKPEDIQSSVVEIQVSEKHPGYNVVHYCSFKNHTAPPNAGGDFGIEALRIGYSFQSGFVSRTLVEYCYFTKCNGDGEIISSKARENVYRYNTFQDNGESHFTLRHGKDNVVYGNFFTGGAGLRIKEGQNQMVYNNYFDTGKRFAIWLVNYKVNPLRNIVIDHNTFINSGTLKLGGKGDFPPKDVVVANNLFVNPTEDPVSDIDSSDRFKHNALDASEDYSLPGDFVRIKANLKKNSAGVFQPTQKSNALHQTDDVRVEILDVPELNDDPEVQLDIMRQKRPGNLSKRNIGCSEFSGKETTKPYATAKNTGPDYLR